ncbi:hypothetical protein NDU88_006774 [Pleurodeles waltl]|uniref:Uncharacterized protein n=1 Tax=Pleurodeles waltl TaxID=8319 RepID=A0AAV7NR75_PLEWA|nr:hypothetical protein NDU88_006774 [Pleurodeles waltl]
MECQKQILQDNLDNLKNRSHHNNIDNRGTSSTLAEAELKSHAQVLFGHCNSAPVTGLPPAEWVAEATLDGVTRKCPRGISNRGDTTNSGNFRVPEEGMARDDTATGEENAESKRGAEEKKDTTREEQGSDGDPNKETDVEESGEEEEKEENRDPEESQTFPSNHPEGRGTSLRGQNE